MRRWGWPGPGGTRSRRSRVTRDERAELVGRLRRRNRVLEMEVEVLTRA